MAAPPEALRLTLRRAHAVSKRPTDRSALPETPQGRLEERQGVQDLARSDEHIPDRLELLPGARVREMPEPVAEHRLGRRAPPDRPPCVEVAVRLPVPGLQLVGGEPA